MSVVAWDGKTLAADKMSVYENTIIKTKKMRKLPSGEVFAWAGSVENALAVVKWYEDGQNDIEWPKCQETNDYAQVVFLKDGKLYEFEQMPIPQEVTGFPRAWGSGATFALGAMAMGADAIKAVKITATLCNTVGLGVDHFTIEKKNDRKNPS